MKQLLCVGEGGGGRREGGRVTLVITLQNIQDVRSSRQFFRGDFVRLPPPNLQVISTFDGADLAGPVDIPETDLPIQCSHGNLHTVWPESQSYHCARDEEREIILVQQNTTSC